MIAVAICDVCQDNDDMVVYLFRRDDAIFPEQERRVRQPPPLVKMMMGKPGAVMSLMVSSHC